MGSAGTLPLLFDNEARPGCCGAQWVHTGAQQKHRKPPISLTSERQGLVKLAATLPWSPKNTTLAPYGNLRLLLLEKPTNSVDPALRCAVWELLRCKAQGRNVLLTTQF